ncbi:MAG: hypothetical protein OEW75_02675 [Cyclobacteriaceae bacterium]|nr:hypothetical protein [Cyclobacteriaceae bacterium]
MRAFKILLITLFLNVTFNSIGQTSYNTESKDSSNIYYFSLLKYCDYLDKLDSQPSIIYIERNYLITDKLPSRIRNYELKYFDQRDVKRFLKGKNQMTLVRIVSLRVNEDSFFVNVIPFTVSYKKKNFNYLNGGGLGVKFEFDVELNGLIFKSAEMGEI